MLGDLSQSQSPLKRRSGHRKSQLEPGLGLRADRQLQRLKAVLENPCD